MFLLIELLVQNHLRLILRSSDVLILQFKSKFIVNQIPNFKALLGFYTLLFYCIAKAALNAFMTLRKC